MKVALINFSGNVGKTTLAKEVFQRNMKCEVYAVESINETSSDSVKINSDDFAELQTKMLLEDDLIIDIGSSNVEGLINQISQYYGSQDEFDYFIVPVIPENKQISDTAQTILHLTEMMGISPKKIKVIFNKVHSKDTLNTKFAPIMALLKELGVPENIAYVLDTPYYSEITNTVNFGLAPLDEENKINSIDYVVNSYEDFRAKAIDYKKKSIASENLNEKEDFRVLSEQYSKLAIISRLGVRVLENLDETFNTLFPVNKKVKK